MVGDEEIAARMRQFAESVGGPTELARKMDISPQQMSNYLSGRNFPGRKMREKLEDAGCDLFWLINGPIEEINVRHKRNIRIMFREQFKGEAALFDVLSEFDISDAAALREILTNWSNVMSMVAESKAKYGGKKK